MDLIYDSLLTYDENDAIVDLSTVTTNMKVYVGTHSALQITGGTLTVTNTEAYSGNYGAKFTSDGSTNYGQAYCYKNIYLPEVFLLHNTIYFDVGGSFNYIIPQNLQASRSNFPEKVKLVYINF